MKSRIWFYQITAAVFYVPLLDIPTIMKIEQNVFNSAFGDALDICWQSSLSHVPEGATLLAEM